MSLGGVAHLGERLNGIQEVVGSIPIVSTKQKHRKAVVVRFPVLFRFDGKTGKSREKPQKAVLLLTLLLTQNQRLSVIFRRSL